MKTEIPGTEARAEDLPVMTEEAEADQSGYIIMDKIKIRITRGQNAILPSYGSPLASGLDIASSENIEISPRKAVLVPTGLKVEIPEGFEGQIRPRSGLALKHSVTVLNSPGTIDSDYRGEVKVILFNHGEETFNIRSGDRIAQMVICPVIQGVWEECDSLDETCRGEGGFGSTGV